MMKHSTKKQEKQEIADSEIKDLFKQIKKKSSKKSSHKNDA